MVWRLIVLTVSLTASLFGCAPVPPHELTERQDHAGLAAWYAQEAARLRAKAEAMRRMADEYARPTYPFSPKESKADLTRHCLLLAESYDSAAQEAEHLARLHREQHGQIP